MPLPEERLRPHPSARFAGSEHAIDLPTALRALRAEPRAFANGHRQITLVHHGPVRIVLFAFDGGGRIPEHRVPGWITIHVLRGALKVRTPDGQHELREGQVLALAPDVPHDIDAVSESDMLLGVYPKGLPGSGAAATR
ncbi:MAG TPA: cupin domain-containing protein [Gemmatimonadaceae bacterium]|nr:cupin domain-containing protein [Gemmatimonadaceae bacterium]